jgi:integrase
LRHRQNLFRIVRDQTTHEFVEGNGHLVRYFGKSNFKSITVQDIMDYVRHRQEEGGTPNTIHKMPKIRVVRPHFAPNFLAVCNTGCRSMELSNCNVGDFNEDRRVLIIKAKGGRERDVPVNDQLLVAVKAELAERPRATPGEPLFVTRVGTRYRSLRTPLIRACETADVPHVTHHGLGHVNPTVMRNI